MNDSTSLIGSVGTIASFTLGQWNNIVGIMAGLFTCTWVVYKFHQEKKK
jgi:hypothetical protein